MPRAEARSYLYLFLCLVQGIIYLVTGIWPLVSIETFQLVTGPKTDIWLVNTVAVVIIAIGVALLASVWRRRPVAEIVVLAAGANIGLAVIDCLYVSRQTISQIYLLDAFIEVVLLAGWVRLAAGELVARARRGSPDPAANRRSARWKASAPPAGRT
jgi:NADH:ubiquinone oxidoreductase subunit K